MEGAERTLTPTDVDMVTVLGGAYEMACDNRCSWSSMSNGRYSGRDGGVDAGGMGSGAARRGASGRMRVVGRCRAVKVEVGPGARFGRGCCPRCELVRPSPPVPEHSPLNTPLGATT